MPKNIHLNKIYIPSSCSINLMNVVLPKTLVRAKSLLYTICNMQGVLFKKTCIYTNIYNYL